VRCLFRKSLKAGKDAYGVDAVPEMLGVATANLGEQKLNTQGRLFISELPDLGLFADSEFDGVLCSAVLMHLPEEQLFDAIYSIRRVLRPNGRLCVSIPSRRDDVDPRTRRDPAAPPFRVSKAQTAYPILGTFVAKIEATQGSTPR